MTENRSLVAWLGGSDLLGMAEDVGGPTREMVYKEKAVGKPRNVPQGPGPIRTLVSALPFRRVHLLTNWGDEVSQAFKAWIKMDVTLHPVSLTNPTSYREVYRAAQPIFKAIWDRRGSNEQM